MESFHRGLDPRPRALAEADTRRGGAALMLALLVLFVLVLIVGQISIGTSTDFRTASNEVQLGSFDLAIESALLKAYEDLRTDAIEDAEAAEAGGAGGAAGGTAGAGLAAGAGSSGLDALSNLPGMGSLPGSGGGAGGASGPTDSRRDLWAQPQRTSEFAPIELRVLIVPESSKLNVLQMLTEDEEEAQKAFERVVRVIDFFREGTEEDVEEYEARDMAEAMLRYMNDRDSIDLPRPDLVTANADDESVHIPISLREFLVLEEFDPEHFRDYRDENGAVVHALTSFLTVHSAIWTRQEMLEARDAAAGNDSEASDQLDELGDQEEDSGNQSRTIPQTGGRITLSADGTISGDTASKSASGQNESSGQSGGSIVEGAINLNTAPGAVLKALFDETEVPPEFWDEVIQWRNEEPDERPGATEEDFEPMLDEFGEEVTEHKIFESPNNLNELEWWKDLEPRARNDVKQHVDVVSSVFTIYVTAWRSTAADAESGGAAGSREEQERIEQSLTNLRRTVACTVWRRGSGEDTEIVPLTRWEVLDYMPYEVLDYPEEAR